ncbi:hypothetical protein PV402_39575 [Streptomyces scabiei]|uniref:DUF7352 domain-containing protein n=1 Tax=Streptomyces scabiei TaxID=1930 RepID=UPI0029BAAAEE|nr:hypothetical protein [Streptomyces scabiei]MDX2658289.1 hypothetical protein [Streptomyces scabiei]MDX2870574.1 hypothetical protein [Streptomyces scabiei]
MALPDVIHRIELPLDDRPHGIDLTGDILHAAVRRPDAVDVWYFARRDDTRHMRRSFQIAATGQPLHPWLGRHHKTAVSPDGQLVWHVLENHCPHQYVLDVGEMKDRPDRPVGICDLCSTHLVGNEDGAWTPR